MTAIQAKILQIVSNQVRGIGQNKSVPVMKGAILGVQFVGAAVVLTVDASERTLRQAGARKGQC